MEQEDGQEPKKHKPFRQPRITPRRIAAAVGFGLIAKGYDMMSVPPEAPVNEAIDGAIFGILLVIFGAGLAVFAVLFKS